MSKHRLPTVHPWTFRFTLAMLAPPAILLAFVIVLMCVRPVR